MLPNGANVKQIACSRATEHDPLPRSLTIGPVWITIEAGYSVINQKDYAMTLEHRLDRLESANRQLRLLAIILGTILVVLVYASRPQSAPGPSPASGAEPPEAIRARRFEVLDDKGNTLVAIGASREGTGELSIYNAGKKQLVSLTGGELYGGNLFIADSSGRTKIMLTCPKSGSGVYRAQNDAGKTVIDLSGTSDGSGLMTVLNNREKLILALGPDKAGAGQLGVHDADGNFKRAFGIAP